MDAGSTVVKLRLRAGMTQSELARGAGTSQAALARYESGTVSPSINTFERLVRAAGAEVKITYPKAPQATLASPKGRLLRKRRRRSWSLQRPLVQPMFESSDPLLAAKKLSEVTSTC